MVKRKNSPLLFLALILTLVSCDHQVVANDSQSLPGEWQAGTEVRFDLPEVTLDTPYDLFVEVRNTNDYAFSNLFLIARLEFPNGKGDHRYPGVQNDQSGWKLVGLPG